LPVEAWKDKEILLTPEKPLYRLYRAIAGGSRPPQIKRAVSKGNSTSLTLKRGE
jgi:hypothetical protein